MNYFDLSGCFGYGRRDGFALVGRISFLRQAVLVVCFVFFVFLGAITATCLGDAVVIGILAFLVFSRAFVQARILKLRIAFCSAAGLAVIAQASGTGILAF